MSGSAKDRQFDFVAAVVQEKKTVASVIFLRPADNCMQVAVGL